MALLAFAGCSSNDKTEATVMCPELRVPDDAAELTRFRPGGAADLTDVAFQARISGTGLNCTKGDGRDTIVDVAIGFEGARGPAATQSAYPVTYFVGVVGPDGAILNRESFSIELQLPDRQSLDARVDEIRVTIPVAEGRVAADYTLIAGIQMTPDELKYNREVR
ncbi:hypothetical protein ABIE65_000100 [Constrictibacter sp. MBR-5]|jgi:hypothetical protein|uniref:hypothetical protein n=1 Tax=Constrictibacter sp. MBR-5 TaxID=3156467 RepID=UPI00339A9840